MDGITALTVSGCVVERREHRKAEPFAGIVVGLRDGARQRGTAPFAEDDPCARPASPYAATKRAGELLCSTYADLFGIGSAQLRFFTVYGPRQRPDMAIHRFTRLIAAGQDVTVFGDGRQTRSLCYVSDLVDGIVRLMESGESDPVNVGNPHELTMLELAQAIVALAGSKSRIVHRPLPVDDPKVRQPDITRARTLLGWEPKVALADGLRVTLAYFKERLGLE